MIGNEMSRVPAIKIIMMPSDSYLRGTIFGGKILSLIDLAAEQHARSVASHSFVTKVMKEVEFMAPVYVGDTICVYTSTNRVGNTSVTVDVEVEVLRGVDLDRIRNITKAEVVMVAIDDQGKPVSLK